MTTVAVLGLRYPDLAIEREILGDIELRRGSGGTAQSIVDLAEHSDVVITGAAPDFTAEVIGRLGRCRAIVRAGTGVDNIALDAARQAGIWVANVPDYGTEAVAQHTLAATLAATRRLVEADRMMRRGGWDFTALRPLHLPSQMTAGVIGYGRVGRRVAELLGLVGFGRVLAHDPFVGHEGAARTSLTVLLNESDVVCLHAPPTAGGGPVLGKDELAEMRLNSVLVNTARGASIDDAALADGLSRGAPRVAALDVFDPEPPDLTVFDGVDERLALSPHMAWYTEESQSDLRRSAAEEAKRILDGGLPLNAIVSPEDKP